MTTENKSFLYRNLRTKTWSRKSSSGKVIDWPLEVLICEPKMVVSAAGRERVKRTKRKVVHAGIRGFVTDIHYKIDTTWNEFTIQLIKSLGFKEITYNPYKHNSFVFVETELPIFEAKLAYLTADMKVYVLECEKK